MDFAGGGFELGDYDGAAGDGGRLHVDGNAIYTKHGSGAGSVKGLNLALDSGLYYFGDFGTGNKTQIAIDDVSQTVTVTGSVLLGTITTSPQSNIVTIDTVTGQLYYTASSAIGGGGGPVDTSGLVTTSSFNSYTSSNTAQFAGTASYATTAQNVLGSITTAATASYATNFTVAQTLTLDETLTDFAKVTSTIVGSNNLFQQATGSYRSAHCKYTLYKTTNARAGEFVTVWNGTTTTYYDNATTDIGSTSDITFQSLITSNQLQVNAVAASSGWTVKMLVTYL